MTKKIHKSLLKIGLLCKAHRIAFCSDFPLRDPICSLKHAKSPQRSLEKKSFLNLYNLSSAQALGQDQKEI